MKKLKILLMYRYIRYYKKDESLHLGFAKAIGRNPHVEIKVYGPYIEDFCPELMISPWSRAVGINDLLDKFHADVIILMTKSRMFEFYCPFDTQDYTSACWLPSGWQTCNIPKVVLEEDYFYENGDGWYADNGINLILQRHYSQALREGRVKKSWFPFSVDANVFYPHNDITRQNKVCFVGGLGMETYIHRRMACEKLSGEGLIDVFSHDEKVGEDYIKCLQQYDCHLSGSLVHNTTPAKLLEIASSGSVLLTNEGPNGTEQMFPRHGYVSYNGDNVVRQVKLILNDMHYRNDTISKALLDIQEKHTHEIRTQELYDLLKKEFNI